MCGTLLAQYGEPFPSRLPVREHREVPSPIIAGDLLPGAFCCVRFEIHSVGRL